MPLIKLEFRPGVDRDQTAYSGEGGWYECDKIRFHSGFPEKIGGWVKYTVNSFLGVCRQMWNWVTSYSDNLLFVGTHVKVYIEAGGDFYDITPLRETDPTMSTPDTDNSVSTTNGSTTVLIALSAAHNATTGNYVTISGVTGNIGGVPDAEINDNHEITVTSANNFTIEVTTPATSTAGPGGGVLIEIDFEIDIGNIVVTAGYGWGTGTWGRGTWGSGSSPPIFLDQRDWWADNFDNDLFFNIRNGPAYYWARGTTSDPATALGTRGILISEQASTDGFDPAAVPVQVTQLLVSQNNKHLIAFGAVPYGSTSPNDFDPLLIRWADQDSPTNWTPSVTTTAGDLRISRGSAIVRALPTRQEILVWTDSNLYTLQFLGTTDVFGLQEYSDNISMMSPRACAAASNVVYWMGRDKFYSYSGSVDTLPCTLRNHVFNDFNYGQNMQVVCGVNEEWDEIWWFYPSRASTWNDKYVVYNHTEKSWYYGSLARTAWLDSPLRTYPQAAYTAENEDSGYLYNHECGLDDDGAGMTAYVKSADFDIGDGDQFMLTRRIIPDVDFGGSTSMAPEVTLTLYNHRMPGALYTNNNENSKAVVSNSAVTQYTQQVFVRSRSRQMAFQIMSEDLGVMWQLGSPRLDARVDGRR